MITTLKDWLSEHGFDADGAAAGDWEVSEFSDAHLLTPVGDQTDGRHYLVRGPIVIAFTPALSLFDEEYFALAEKARLNPVPDLEDELL